MAGRSVLATLGGVGNEPSNPYLGDDVMGKSVSGTFVFDDGVYEFTRTKSFVVDVRDENGRVASISEVIASYEQRDFDSGLLERKAGYVETVYSPDGLKKRGVRVEVVTVAPAVPDDVMLELFDEGVDWESRLMKIRRRLAGKRTTYGVGASIGEMMEGRGYSFTQLPTAHEEDMAISAWNHSGSARVAAAAKQRKAKAPVDLSILGL